MATRVRAVRGARKMRAFAKKGALRTAATPAEWNELLNSVPGLLVVEFTAPWSAPCKAMAPYLGLLASQPEYSTVVFARVDVRAAWRGTPRQPCVAEAALADRRAATR